MRKTQTLQLALALVLVVGTCLPHTARAQDPGLESWLAGGDPLPALDGPAPAPADVPLHYWEPDNLVRLGREWGYLLERVKAARELLGDREPLGRIETEATRVVESCEEGDESLLGYLYELNAKLARHRGAVNALVTQAPVVAISWDEPYTRLEPAVLAPATPTREWQILALRGEQCAVGLLVVNCTGQRSRGSLRLTGLDPTQVTCQVRQHVFVEDWYLRGKRRTGDPLPLLEQTNGAWRFDLPPGGVVKLHLGIHILPEAAGTTRGQARVAVRGAEPTTLDLTLRTPRRAAPVTEFEHLAFMYHTWGVQGRMPEAAAADMAAHGVTMFEFIRTPKCSFDAEGNLLSVDFSAHEPYLKTYLPHGARPMVYWIDPLRTPDGEEIPHASPAWNRAFCNLLRAFLDRMAELGYGPERFVVMPVDEPHGGGYDGGEPDEHVMDLAETLATVKQSVPELPIVMTITYYASAPVVEAIAPYVDIFVPHWPWPEKLSAKSVPPGYNPREAFERDIMPILETERAERGAPVLSYTVANGATHGLLWGNRAFPIIAFGKGFTGVSHWAYNNATGSTWHGWDGKPWLDYIFVYDGTEDHPFNHAWNGTGETLVPSIRWEALRAGIQDAHLLMRLNKRLETGRLRGRVAERARRAIAAAEALAQDESPLTDEGVAQLSRELREIYLAAGR